jgi:hypothetical protein
MQMANAWNEDSRENWLLPLLIEIKYNQRNSIYPVPWSIPKLLKFKAANCSAKAIVGPHLPQASSRGYFERMAGQMRTPVSLNP